MIIVGVRFRKAGKIYFFDPETLLDLPYGTAVIVDTSRGAEFGKVVVPPRDVDPKDLVHPVRKVLRVASSTEKNHKILNSQREEAARKICKEKIAQHGLFMDLVEAEMSFDAAKIVFYFTAEGRVDFRELVKDLATTLRMRIELRQIGVRDEAKIVSGMGACGRELCCSSFLEEFSPISIKTAKDQGLSLNPTKISGCCGKLMCCLKYEEETYSYLQKNLPRMGAIVETPDGPGEVVGQNIMSQSVKVALNVKGSDERQVNQYDVGQLRGGAKGHRDCKDNCADCKK